MNSGEIQRALDDVFDQAVVFHAFADYMRDYEMITYSVLAPSTGILPAYDRYLFRYTVEVTTTTTVTQAVWSRSLDDRLIDYEQGKDLEGYVWGVRWHLLYPGGTVIADSARARHWTEALGMEFHQVFIETNAHKLALVFADLEVSRLDPGYAPFVVHAEDHYVPPTPLA